jgi:hypothetical protein
MQGGPGGEGEATDGAGVVWDFRFDENEVHFKNLKRSDCKNFRKKKGEPTGPPFFPKKKYYLEKLRLVGECHIDAAAFFIEVNASVRQGEKGVILAHSDVGTGMPFGATLADEDVTGDDCFSAEFFHAEAFAVRVASVFNGTLSFFVSHV